MISDIALTKDNPLHCALVGGQWIGPDNTPVQCGESSSDPFNCSQSSDSNRTTLYRRSGVPFSDKQLNYTYACSSSKQNISIQIERELSTIIIMCIIIFSETTGNTVLSAIYIEPPADVRSIPQSYTIHCITVGKKSSDINVGMYLERHGQSYYNFQVPPVLGYYQNPPYRNTLNSTTLTYDYSEEVVWRADRVEDDSTEFNKQGLTKYNGDHDWACGVNYPTSRYDDLQTYIRGEQSSDSIINFIYLWFGLAPNFAPTELNVFHDNATSVTISWTAVNHTEADGYVVYINHQHSDTYSAAVIVGNTRQYTLWYDQPSLPLYGYNITVRAHQDLLGPTSTPLLISTVNCKLVY